MNISSIVLMGVTGSGKSTVGKILAQRLGWLFYDGDDFHSPANVAKMHQGQALTSADRAEWLQNLADLLRQNIAQNQPLVLACSALQAAYRAVLQVDPMVTFVYLRGTEQLIHSRLQKRTNHFMNPKLLGSQFAALEEPPDSLTVDIDQPVQKIVDTILQSLHSLTVKPPANPD